MPIPDRLNPSFASTLPATPVAIFGDGRGARRLIVALDVPNAAAALDLVNRLERSANGSRWGWSCSSPPVPLCLEMLVARGHSIFLDLKFHDIPNTVAGAVRSAAGLGVRMVNVHASGGPAMLAAAQAALEGVPIRRSCWPLPC